MKIAMIGQKGIPATFGGVERHVEEISYRLAQQGYSVYVYSRPYYTPKSKVMYRKVNIVSIPTLRTKHLDAISHTFLATWHAMLFLKADVIHYHAIGPALCSWIPKFFTPHIKVVFTFHSRDYFHQKWGILARLFLMLGEKVGCLCADQILAVSEDIQQYIKKTYNKPSAFIPHGSTKERYLSPVKIKKWGLKRDSYVLVVSRLIPHKGIHYIVKAFQRLKTNKKLAIAGSGFHTDSYEESLKAMVKDDKRIMFLGNVQGRALKELYSNAFLLVHPSEQEGFPLVVLEAASFGKALLLSNIPEHKKIFAQLPFFFRNKNVSDLRNQLQAALKNSKLVKQKGRSIREYSLANYDWEKSCRTIISSYH